MTTYATSTQAIYDYVIDNVASITGIDAANIVTGRNVNYTPTSGTAYLQVNVLPGQDNQTSIGAQANFQNTGLAVFDLFFPANTGDVAAKIAMQDIHNLFRLATIETDIHFKGEISSREFGLEGDFYRLQTTLVFRRNILYTI